MAFDFLEQSPNCSGEFRDLLAKVIVGSVSAQICKKRASLSPPLTNWWIRSSFSLLP